MSMSPRILDNTVEKGEKCKKTAPFRDAFSESSRKLDYYSADNFCFNKA